MFCGASNARDTPNISKKNKNMIYILSAQLINEGMSLQRERERTKEWIVSSGFLKYSFQAINSNGLILDMSSPEVLVIGETKTSEAKLIPATWWKKSRWSLVADSSFTKK